MNKEQIEAQATFNKFVGDMIIGINKAIIESNRTKASEEYEEGDQIRTAIESILKVQDEMVVAGVNHQVKKVNEVLRNG